ncbi:general transcription factor II-I repeat domain-containing protein 2B-like [Melanaphis sacchari]|uniref:general transcription factor II-I repeat domain-containing protein 2B-like n=1 Tax=Melanaphis sacchari TaxID=742174 RepID=UPI000DC1395E|nr:general transcription factor II-I repeat domain-containing protein 2B-like [Melanaphis sacchari]
MNGQQYPTYKDTCLALSLLEDDNQWDCMLSEAALNFINMSKSGRAKRLVSLCNTTTNNFETLTHDYLSDSNSELAFDQSSDEEYTSYNNTVQSENESSAEIAIMKGIGKEEIIRASYEVANLISRENKSFSDGDFVKKCILASVKEIIPEKMSVFENISLSRHTITRRVEDIGGDLMSQLQIKSKTFKFFSLALDESTDLTDTALFIRGIDTDFNITEELASLESISGTTTGADIFEKVNSCLTNLGLTWEKLCSITTDGAPNMVGRNTGLIGRITEFTTSKMFETPIFLHCIIHQQSLCGKIMNLEHVMKVVTKTVNFIRSHGLKHRQFVEFLN